MHIHTALAHLDKHDYTNLCIYNTTHNYICIFNTMAAAELSIGRYVTSAQALFRKYFRNLITWTTRILGGLRVPSSTRMH